MKGRRRALTLAGSLLSLTLMLTANGQERSSDIEALLDKLQVSGCQFRRNGLWYTGDVASKHLSMKVGHMRKLNPQLSVEEFIVQGASGSSVTQQPYKVRCMNSPEMLAADWMNQQLKLMRDR